VLLGRDTTLGTLDGLLARARGGTSGVLVLTGEAGIGKTALLEEVAARAAGRSMTVLRARGVESEADIPFAGLSELLRPAAPLLDRLPAPQARAIAGALSLDPTPPGDRLAVGAATLSLLAMLAEDGPVAVLIDDEQWLDRASADAVGFAARRLMADPVAVVIAARVPSASQAGLPSLPLAGLSEPAAAALAERRLGAPLGADARAALYAATTGNPLAIVELAGSAESLAATPGVPPSGLPERLQVAFLRQVEDLPPTTRRALLLLAASDRSELAVIAPAADRLGLDLALLGAAEERGVVVVRDGRAEFGHPLLRSAVYGAAAPSERRAVHAALGLAAGAGDLDRRAWHLAAAAFGPDPGAAQALEDAAARAASRGGAAVASAGYARAAGLAPDAADRRRLLWKAADAALQGGLGDRALDLLDAAEQSPGPPDPTLLARIGRTRGHVLLGAGQMRAGHAALVAAADVLAPSDPDAAVLALTEATSALFWTGDATAMVATGSRAEALAEAAGTPQATFFGRLAHGIALVVAGQGDRGAAAIRAALAVDDRSAAVPDDARLVALAVMAPQFLRQVDGGREVMAQAVAAARAEGRIGILPMLLFHVARDAATTDDLAGARAAYGESIRLAREAGLTAELAASLAGLAWLEARLGLGDDSAAHADEAAELAERFGLALLQTWAAAARAEVALGAGDPAVAVRFLEQQQAVLDAAGIRDADLSPAPDLVPAYLQLRRHDDASAAGTAFASLAEAKDQPWSLARAERVRGILATDDPDRHFARALELHAQTLDEYERGRTQLAYGERLRRDRRRTDARVALRAAVETFDAIGAEPWADRAAAELRATGETARRRVPATLNDLTPQELQIALLLVEGRTRREAASALFLSPKTIEYHLRNVYNKLGISTRDELRAALRPGNGGAGSGAAGAGAP
jgi:DNA-binding CsgD family transcriptional regulator